MDKTEIRKDYFRDSYVIIAPNRAKRPQKIEKSEDSSADSCFFCPKNFVNKRIVYQDDNQNGEWEIVSFLNDYPAVSLDNDKSYGQAEVIIETNQHGLDIDDFSIEYIVRVFDAYINRYLELKKIDGIRHVILFKNEGGKAGASIAHTHSQIIALPLLPPKIKVEFDAYNKYIQDNNRCPFCDVIKNEENSDRMIWQDENIFVVAPYASESPYEAWFIPRRHIHAISDLNYQEKLSLAKSMKKILGKLNEIGVSYNYFVENLVDSNDYHMHIKLFPRPNIWAGLELGTGIIVNSIPPEVAAEFYKS